MNHATTTNDAPVKGDKGDLMTQQLAVRLPNDLIDRIDRLCTARQENGDPLARVSASRSEVIRSLLADGVERAEAARGLTGAAPKAGPKSRKGAGKRKAGRKMGGKGKRRSKGK